MKPETIKSITVRAFGIAACAAKVASITYAINVLIASEFGLNPFGFLYVFACLFAIDMITGKEHDYIYTDDEEKLDEAFCTLVNSVLLSSFVYLYQ